jgi:hypothetical protein
MSSNYDPFAHAEDLGIQIHYRRLRTANGLWIPEFRAIMLQPGMRAIHERSILSHEIAHALLGHRDGRPKHEVLADRLAADNLIDQDEIAALLTWTDDIPKVCLELGVSMKLFRVYANVHLLGRQQGGDTAQRIA